MDTNGRSILDIFKDSPVITAAVQRAVREAVLRDAREGVPVPTWKDGKVVWVSPEEILAQFGESPATKPAQ